MFSGSKSERDVKSAPAMADTRISDVSTIGKGMQITGNIVCAGALEIHGRVTGDIHAAQLSVRAGAQVDGKIVATDVLVEGAFNGTIHGNTVKLQKSGAVEGEIYNKSLSIEQDARFEGVSRRLERAVEAPTNVHKLEGVAAVPLTAAE